VNKPVNKNLSFDAIIQYLRLRNKSDQAEMLNRLGDFHQRLRELIDIFHAYQLKRVKVSCSNDNV
jgi:hypothetical protein